MSGGQRQRVAIGRAIVREPEVFLLDEPLSNLDAKLRVDMRTELQRLHKELDTTIIYVTHDQAEAMTMSDRIAVIDSGQLQQIDPPLTCYNEPENLFVAGFIGSPAMNFVDGKLPRRDSRRPNFAVDFDPTTIEGVGVGDDVTLGIRPEDIYPPTSVRGVPSLGNDVVKGGSSGVTEQRTVARFVECMLHWRHGELLMSIDPDSDLEEDEELGVVIDRRNVHLFARLPERHRSDSFRRGRRYCIQYRRRITRLIHGTYLAMLYWSGISCCFSSGRTASCRSSSI